MTKISFLADNLMSYVEKKRNFICNLDANSTMDTSSGEPPEIFNTQSVDVGGQVTLASHSIGVGVFFSEHEDYVPVSFDQFVERTHTLPQTLVFVKLKKTMLNKIDASERFKIKSFPANIFCLTLNLPFFGKEIPLLPTIEEALNSINITDANISERKAFTTVYWCNEAVRISSKMPFYIRIPLFLYSIVKSSFPSELIGVQVDYENLVTLTHIRVLE